MGELHGLQLIGIAIFIIFSFTGVCLYSYQVAKDLRERMKRIRFGRYTLDLSSFALVLSWQR